jgi:transposase
MRGSEQFQEGMFSYVSPAQRVPQDHPLRPIRKMVDEALKELSPKFAQMYSDVGRPSIPPEQLLRALLLQVFYTVRSERQLMEQLDYNLLFRWFVGLSMDEAVWDATVFSKNRERLLGADVARLFFQKVLDQAREKQLMSNEHFTVDGTLIEAWAGQKSFKKKTEDKQRPPDDPGNPTVNFHGEKRRNDTHQSTTDPDARLYRKGPGKPSQLCYQGHVLMDNRHGLATDAIVTKATGTAERDAALKMLKRRWRKKRQVTVGGDKGYDTNGFVGDARKLKATPHVAQNTNRRGGSAIDSRTARHAGYAISQKVRKRVEEIFGWMKTVGTMRKTRHRGTDRVDWMFTFTAAAYNLIRMRNIQAESV